jgi:hypothetical protein
MNAVETISASAVTALAISKATKSGNDANAQNLQTTLRLSNLEKALKKQEQKTNEVSNAIKSKTKCSQKSFHGGHIKEPATFMEQQAPIQHMKQTTKQQMVDFTTEAEEDEVEHLPKGTMQRKPPTYRQRQQRKKRRTQLIHWKRASLGLLVVGSSFASS